ncbi:hypothetical protein MTR_5g070595 [Medicago truncatula]|uniref:Uncharacterized protein n=1 Tax=Medicago truncatula TaxID=3880 RepID=A0A072UFD3_MEDTR|nr:hypothetical protein MTR_5g070595 [Medicago truncatula]
MTAEAYQWKDTLCRFTNGDSFHTFLSIMGLYRQRLDLFTIISSPRKFAECLYCDVSPPPILPILSRLIESLVT